MEEFQIKGKILSQKEKIFLQERGFRWCNVCKKAHPKELFLENPEIRMCETCRKEVAKKAREKHKERDRAYKKRYRKENRETLNQKTTEWRRKNNSRLKENYKLWREENKERLNENRRNVYARNKEKYQLIAKRFRLSKKEDPLYKLMYRIRKRVRTVFAKNSVSKTRKSMDMLGCTWEELKIHIEKQFTEGMSWERLKEIHIDHIVPLSSAKNEEELIRLAHYTNLQPLWAKDNLSKSNKLNWSKN